MAATVYERDNSVGTGAVSLRYRNRAEITLLMWEEKPYPVYFSPVPLQKLSRSGSRGGTRGPRPLIFTRN